ncbi:MAG: addiction module protein, partial [Labilithrix sp.]|nr:addiction module protein [Labilithrix sp.]
MSPPSSSKKPCSSPKPSGKLAATLLDSLEPPLGISIEDREEIERRAEEARSGVPGIPWEEVKRGPLLYEPDIRSAKVNRFPYRLVFSSSSGKTSRCSRWRMPSGGRHTAQAHEVSCSLASVVSARRACPSARSLSRPRSTILRASSGEQGIRTLGTLAGTPD